MNPLQNALILIIIQALLITACTYTPIDASKYNTKQLELVWTDTQLMHNGRPSYSVEFIGTTGKCIIISMRQYGLQCIKHAIKHCYEGPWHGDKPSIKYCE